MTLRLEINGIDFTAKWRPYESHWSRRAYMGEAAGESVFIIDDVDGTIDHADFATYKVLTVWEDASGTDVCMYKGRITTKQLGRGPHRTGVAMQWTITAADSNYELRGIRVSDSHRPEESDRERVLAYIDGYLSGSASTNPHARDSTDIDGAFVIAADLITMPATDYTDTYPDQVFLAISELSAKTFFVFTDGDGIDHLYYASHTDDQLEADISLSDLAGAADGIDTYYPDLAPPTGIHDGLNVITGGSVRYGDDQFFEGSDLAGGEADHDKWEEHFTDEYINTAGDALGFLTNTVASRSNEDFTFPLTWTMTADNAHRIQAGYITSIRVASANVPTAIDQRATQVAHQPLYPDADGNAVYRITAEFGLPRGRAFQRHIRTKPGPFAPTQPTAGTCTRWYFTDDAGASNITVDAAWDNSGFGTGGWAMDSAPSNSVNGQNTWSAINAAVGDYGVQQWSKTLTADEAAAISAGGTFRFQMRARSRYGAGINEATQENYATLGLRIKRGGSIIGTPIAVGSAVGATKFIPQAVWINRSVEGSFSAVSAVAGDVAFLEVGTHHVFPTSGAAGVSMVATDTSADDLPEDNSSIAADNTWFEFCTGSTAGSETEPTTGDGEGTPGTSNVFAPIDHVHPHGMLDPDGLHMHAEYQVHQMVTNSGSDPTVTDDAEAGYSRGWHWNNTTTGDVFFLRDSTEGAADWLLIAPESGSPGGSAELVPLALSAAPSGGWNVNIGGPDAVHYNGHTYYGYVEGTTGDIEMRVVSNLAGERAEAAITLKSALDTDTHAGPTFLVRDSDHKLMVWYSAHNDNNLYQRISVNSLDTDPLLAGGFGSEVDLDSSLGGTAYTYASPAQLDTGIFLSFRYSTTGAGQDWGYAISTDEGATWPALTKFFDEPSRYGYVKSVRNSGDRIDFVIQDGSIANGDADTSILHFYYDASANTWHKSDGTSAGSLPLDSSDMTMVYNGSGAGDPAAISDIAVDHRGQPFIAFRRWVTSSNDRYMWTYWTGSAWATPVEITNGGYFGTSYVSGGMALDSKNPTIVYTSIDVSGKLEMSRWRTRDRGATWDEEQITTGSSTENMFPVSPFNRGAALPVLWMDGSYTSATSFNIGTSGLFIGEAEAEDHDHDSAHVHDAADITFDPTGLSNTSATDVQEAIEDLDGAIAGGGIAGTIFDAKGDIIAGTANDAYDNLPAGTDGQILYADSSQTTGLLWDDPPSGGSGVSSGTSFPGSPSNNDLFYRTDRDLLYFYDGTRWLTVNEYDIAPGWDEHSGAAINSTQTVHRWPVRQDFGMYLVRWAAVTFQTNGTPASNNMTVVLARVNASNTATTITSFVNSSDTASNWVNHDQAINAVLDSSARILRTVATEAGTVTGFILAESIVYRLIG